MKIFLRIILYIWSTGKNSPGGSANTSRKTLKTKLVISGITIVVSTATYMVAPTTTLAYSESIFDSIANFIAWIVETISTAARLWTSYGHMDIHS